MYFPQSQQKHQMRLVRRSGGLSEQSATLCPLKPDAGENQPESNPCKKCAKANIDIIYNIPNRNSQRKSPFRPKIVYVSSV